MRQKKPRGSWRLLRRKEGLTADREEGLGGGQAEKGRQAVWNPEKGERDPLRRFRSSIASQPLIPGQAVMRPLGSRNRRRGGCNRSGESWVRLDLQALAMQMQTGSSLVPSAPVSPQERSRSHCQGMEEDADLARFGRCAPA